MLGKKAKARLIFLVIAFLLLTVVIFLIFRSLEKNVVYFFSPTEIEASQNLKLNKKIRIGGLVKENSVTKNNTTINFVITDLKNEIIVSYKGIVPNLFSEGKGVVAEGKLKDKNFFLASKILAKHDENYMPPEVSKALEKSN